MRESLVTAIKTEHSVTVLRTLAACRLSAGHIDEVDTRFSVSVQVSVIACLRHLSTCDGPSVKLKRQILAIHCLK